MTKLKEHKQIHWGCYFNNTEAHFCESLKTFAMGRDDSKRDSVRFRLILDRSAAYKQGGESEKALE